VTRLVVGAVLIALSRRRGIWTTTEDDADTDTVRDSGTGSDAR
jgi:hypothetical protein